MSSSSDKSDSSDSSSPPEDDGGGKSDKSTPAEDDSGGKSDKSSPSEDNSGGKSDKSPPSEDDSGGKSSDSPPPPKSDDSGDSPPSPPPKSDSSSSPPPTKDATPPPPKEDKDSSPPPESTPSKSPPKSDSSPSPPSPTTPAQSAAPSPKKSKSPSASSSSEKSPPTEVISPPPPSRSSSNSSPSQTKSISPPSGDSSSNSPAKQSKDSPSDGDSGGINSKALIAAAVTGAVLIMLLAVCCCVVKCRKKRSHRYPPHYIQPHSLNQKTDGYYYGNQQPSGGFSGPSNYSYGSQPMQGSWDGYGSQGFNASGSQGFNGGGSQGMGYLGIPDNGGVIGGSKNFFTHEEIMEMTNGFARQNIIGEGGFGCVFKGWLPDGKVVAVKQLKAGSGQGDREFRAEVEIISRVHHRHLVSLVGYSVAENQRSLIYEFLPNNTLEHHLHAQVVLDWPKRLKIAIGSAKGLAYLHEDCHPKIIHRDIKSANILLDDDFEAQVADFGLARLNDTTQTHVSTRVMGTFGYLAPEYASSGKLTDRSDVYSFGVVLLELITGRKPVDPTQPLGDESLVEWARPLLLHALETRDLGGLVDPRLEKHYNEIEMFRMVETAAACVRHSAPKRPRMVQVVRALDTEGEMSSDLTNGVKYGQSTIYDSAQYNQDIMKFRMMALGGDSSEFETRSGYSMSGESETRAMNPPRRF